MQAKEYFMEFPSPSVRIKGLKIKKPLEREKFLRGPLKILAGRPLA